MKLGEYEVGQKGKEESKYDPSTLQEIRMYKNFYVQKSAFQTSSW